MSIETLIVKTFYYFNQSETIRSMSTLSSLCISEFDICFDNPYRVLLNNNIIRVSGYNFDICEYEKYVITKDEINKLIDDIIIESINQCENQQLQSLSRYAIKIGLSISDYGLTCILMKLGYELKLKDDVLYVSKRDSDLLKALIGDPDNITYDHIKQIAKEINIHEETVALRLSNIGYCFKLSNSDFKDYFKTIAERIIDERIKEYVSNAKDISIEKLREFCNDKENSNSEEIIDKYNIDCEDEVWTSFNKDNDYGDVIDINEDIINRFSVPKVLLIMCITNYDSGIKFK